MLREGTRLDNTYTLVRKIGSGGGGIVYKAYHERLQTYVVVKQVKDKVKGKLDSRAEADILKNIKHTRLPRVYDFLELEGEIFTVMDYIPGMSLDQALKQEGRFGQKEIYGWVLQIADALAYLHSQTPPIIHSDIKPANVMLTPKRDICLIDFNVSLAFDQDMRTSTSISGGYSPPEQYRDYKTYCGYLNKKQALGQPPTQTMTGAAETIVMNYKAAAPQAAGLPGEMIGTESLVAAMTGKGVDERSDIYSLGATAYHLLTGVKPALDFEEIVPVTNYEIPLSEGFGLIINKMMELNPDNRYQNGIELLDALEHIYELDSEYQAFRRKGRKRKIFFAVLYTAGILSAVSGWKLMDQETEAAYSRSIERADELINNAAFDKAQNEIENAMSLIPDKVDAYEKETLRLYRMGDYEGAVRYGQNAVSHPVYKLENQEQETALGNIFYIVGNAYIEQDKYVNAVRYLKEAVDLNQKNSLYYRDYAIALAKTGDVESAQSALDTAAKLDLGEASIYMVQGEIACSKGDDETAIQCLNASVRTAESSELRRRAVILCAQTYRRLGEAYLDEEIRLLEQARNWFGLDTSMYLAEQLADAYARKASGAKGMEAEYYPKSLELFKELCEQGYSTRQMMENIAVIYQQMDQLEQAKSVLDQITEQYPGDYRAFKRLAFLEADKQQKKRNESREYRKMKAYYDKASELYDSSGEDGDTEMQMLGRMMEELRDGGWL